MNVCCVHYTVALKALAKRLRVAVYADYVVGMRVCLVNYGNFHILGGIPEIVMVIFTFCRGFRK